MLFGVVYGIFNQNPDASHRMIEALIHLVVASLVGWGIYKKYKPAALAGLTLAFLGIIGNWFSKGIIDRNTVLSFLTTFMFLQSTRGILAHHGRNRDIKP